MKNDRQYWADLGRRAIAAGFPCDPSEESPDLQDPANVGRLLAEVRRVYGCPLAHARTDRPSLAEPGRPWLIHCGDGTAIVGVYPTEAEAMVAALEYHTAQPPDHGSIV